MIIVNSRDELIRATDGKCLVEGRMPFEHSESGKDDIQIMMKCCEAEAATFFVTGNLPAPFYFERVAILKRKEKDYAGEISVCEMYLSMIDDYYARMAEAGKRPGVDFADIAAGARAMAIKRRLSKAQSLLAKSKG